jgi:hypothetical protein
VAERLQEDGTPYIYADLWGVRSIADVVGVFGEAYARASGLSRARRSVAELLWNAGFEVTFGGVVSVRYEGVCAADRLPLLRARLEGRRRGRRRGGRARCQGRGA